MARPPSRRELLWAWGSGLVVLGRPWRAHAQASGPEDTGWPIFRGDAALRGVAASGLPPSPKLMWSFEAESEPTSPVVASGRVIFATRDGDLVALDLSSGKRIWATKVEAGFEAAPSCTDGLVLIPDLGGGIHALGAADGKKVWFHQTPGEAEIKASVAVASGVALVGSYDGTLHALNLSDGARRWSHESEAQIHATCAILNGVAYVAGCDGHFRGLDVVTGKEKVDVPFGGYTAASPAIVDGIAVFGTFSNDVVGIDIARKAVIWRYVPKKQFPFYSSALVGGWPRHRGFSRQVSACAGPQDRAAAVDVRDPGEDRLVSGSAGFPGFLWIARRPNPGSGRQNP